MKITKLLVIILSVLAISNCGFQPIYKTNTKKGQTNYEDKLASISIVPGKKRIDQKLKNNLEEILNPNKIDAEKQYLLKITISKSTSTTFINITGSSGRNKTTLNANYQLNRISDNENISSGTAVAKDDFDVEDKRFANYIAEEEIELNLTRIVAQNIRDLLINDLFNTPDQTLISD